VTPRGGPSYGPTVIIAAEPCVFTTDFARAEGFYVGKLGFRLELAHGDPPSFGLLVRDGARLSLRLVDGPVFREGVREREELLAASLTLASAAVFQPPRTEPWGARTFIVRDPDGNLLLAASPAA
jgi:catechol 2,3-dioxygenase-like lactoylglutathione lyase family enzyme